MRSRAPVSAYSRSVRPRSSGGRWSCRAMRVPFANASSPPWISLSPTSIRSSVVLPAPLGPESASRCRRSTVNETPSNRSEPASSLRRLDAVTTGIGSKRMPVLALDVGSSSVRAGPYDDRGREAGVAARREYQSRHGQLDADELLEAVQATLAEAGEGEALGISCFWHSLLLLDDRDRPLTPVLLWQDRRAAPQAEALAARLDAAAV